MAYLDEFQAELSKIASDETLSIYEMQAKTKELGQAFLAVQNQIPTSEIQKLNEQYRAGKLSSEEYNAQLNKQIEVVETIANSLREAQPEVAALFDAIAKGYRDFASGATSSDVAKVDLSGFNEQISKIDELAKGYSILKDAQQQYTKLGYLTADMWASLADSNLVGYLDFSTGALQINTQAFQNNVEAAKTAALSKLQDAAAADINALALGHISEMSPLAQSAIGYFGTQAETAGNQARDGAAKINAMANSLANTAAAAEGKTSNVGQFRTQVDLVISAYKGAAKSMFAMQPASTAYQNAMGGAKASTDTLTDSLKAEKEALEETKKALEDKKSQYDSALRAINKLLDDEIEKLNKEKEALSDPDIMGSYGQRIKAIQDEIDALNDANSAKEKQIALEKAQAALERAQRQKSMRVYRAGIGFVYVLYHTARHLERNKNTMKVIANNLYKAIDFPLNVSSANYRNISLNENILTIPYDLQLLDTEQLELLACISSETQGFEYYDLQATTGCLVIDIEEGAFNISLCVDVKPIKTTAAKRILSIMSKFNETVFCDLDEELNKEEIYLLLMAYQFEDAFYSGAIEIDSVYYKLEVTKEEKSVLQWIALQRITDIVFNVEYIEKESTGQ